MSRPSGGLPTFGVQVGACGVGGQQGRGNNGVDAGFFACSAPTNTGNGRRRTPRASVPPSEAFLKALHTTMLASDSNFLQSSPSTAVSSVESSISKARSTAGARPMERRRIQRSGSFQPSTSRIGQARKFPLMDLTIQTKPSTETEVFILPQYVKNQYANKDQTIASGKLSRRDTDEESSASTKRKCHHVQCLPHGAFWTILAILIPWAGMGLAVLSRQSLHFITLEKPWHVASIYEDIDALGVIHAGICYNETVTSILDESKVGCFKITLATNDDLEDPIFKLAAVFASISVLMGFILTFSMSTTVIWKTINFRAIGTGYLFVYCFQSLAFLFFDTDICETHKCKIDIGCIYCIAASICWISSCLLCAKMESNRAKKDLAEERKRRKKAAAKEALKRRSIVHRSGATVVTERTLSTLDDDLTLDLDEELGLSLRDKSNRSRHMRHRSLSSSRNGVDMVVTTHKPKRQNHRDRSVNSTSRHSSRYTSMASSHSTGRSRHYGTPKRAKSMVSQLTMNEFSTSGTRQPTRTDFIADIRTPKRSKSMVSPISMNEFSAGGTRQPNYQEFVADFKSPSPIRHATSGIEKQHKSIITLDPTGRFSGGQTTISALTPVSLDNTLDNPNRGRVEYQGKVLPQRGRSRSKSKPRARPKSISRAGPRCSTSSEQQRLLHRSRSRGRLPHVPRTRPSSQSKRIRPTNSSYATTTTRDFEEAVHLAMKRAQRKSLVRTTREPANSGTFVNVPISPLPHHRSATQSQAPEPITYVTSYFDI